jgi:hypothetical protein
MESALHWMGVDQPFWHQNVGCASRFDGTDWQVSVVSDSMEVIYLIETTQINYPSGALLFGISEYLKELLEEHQIPSITLEVNDRHALNVINRYLSKWASNNWMTTRGPVKDKAIMQSLWERLQHFPSVEAKLCRQSEMIQRARRGFD